VDGGEPRAGGGGPWKVYVIDPGEVPDPAQWVTEINWPLLGF
jgi:hypothetical protein